MPSYKFLAEGGDAPLSGFHWPLPDGATPGAWVSVDGDLRACARGIHVCRPTDLAHWLHDELWEMEVSGPELEATDCVVVPRARILRKVEAWSDGGGRRFIDAALEHASPGVDDLMDDARAMGGAGYFALAAYTAALAVSRVHPDREAAFRAERLWQSDFIARLIGA